MFFYPSPHLEVEKAASDKSLKSHQDQQQTVFRFKSSSKSSCSDVTWPKPSCKGCSWFEAALSETLDTTGGREQTGPLDDWRRCGTIVATSAQAFQNGKWLLSNAQKTAEEPCLFQSLLPCVLQLRTRRTALYCPRPQRHWGILTRPPVITERDNRAKLSSQICPLISSLSGFCTLM